MVPSLSEAIASGEPALALAPSRFVDRPVITRLLGEVRFGVVGRQGHRALRARPTTARWLEHGHVVVRLAVSTSDLLMNALIPLVQEAATTLKLAVRAAPIRLPRVRVSVLA